MSLDVSLCVPRELSEHELQRLAGADLCEESGMLHAAEILRADIARQECVYEANITHNLAKMASEAGLYDACWRPEENGLEQARQLVPLLKSGLERLLADPERFKAFNPANGWGSYGILVSFVRRYLQACEEHPEGTVHACR